MNDLATIAQTGLVLAALVLPIVALVRYLAGSEDYGAATSWPRGVQEEDPQPWKFAPSAA